MMIEVLILAGGLASRLMPYTEKIPKSLISVAGRPFIYHQLDLMLAQDVKKVILCVGHYGKMIEERVGENYKEKIKIVYSYDGAELLGTGKAIHNALDKINQDSFFVMYGDTYLLEPLVKIHMAFDRNKFDSLLAVYKNQNQWDKSNSIYKNGKVILYNKTNPTKNMNFIDYGISIFKKSVFKKYENRNHYDLSKVMYDLSIAGKLAGYEAKSRFYEIGSHNGLIEFDDYLKYAK